MSSLSTPEQRIEEIKRRTEEIRMKKVQAEAQLQVLQQQYDQKVEELKQVGIVDLNNIPATIKALEDEIQALLVQTETELTNIEASIK